MKIKQGDLVFVTNAYGIHDKDMETFGRDGPRYLEISYRCFNKKTNGIVVGEKPKYVDYHNNNSVAFAYYKILMSTNEVVWIRQPEIKKNS